MLYNSGTESRQKQKGSSGAKTWWRHPGICVLTNTRPDLFVPPLSAWKCCILAKTTTVVLICDNLRLQLPRRINQE
ncbi:Uncharacterized protein HZ326_8580 [Fusarium oxysporum f. sp. albedinis]|nr:Uncharacterized protein HZ326_8580 [Fusarium oxysporum f. sp. albedinis]